MTPAQQVSWVRDVPVSCICEQVWRDGRDGSGRFTSGGARWVRSVVNPLCPWHGHPQEAPR